jgi:two-component system sensor histidine kinase KdpD
VRDGRRRVSVTDDGPGISREALPRLFEPFYRARGAPRGGSGLGLAVARGLVEAHGGRIWAENRPEGGAAFTFEIPAEDAGTVAEPSPAPA